MTAAVEGRAGAADHRGDERGSRAHPDRRAAAGPAAAGPWADDAGGGGKKANDPGG